MAEFLPAYSYMMGNEDPHGKCELVIDNNGAETIAGINGKFWPNTVEALKRMSGEPKKVAIAGFYRQNFWPPNFEHIKSQKVAGKLLDMCVNFGFHEGIILCQKALNKFTVPHLVEDGAFGSKTLDAINGAPEEVMLQSLCVEGGHVYRNLAQRNPEQNAAWLDGWLRRAEKVPA